MTQRRILFVVLDGLGDRPSPERGDETPLAAAATPYLDQLAVRGQTGLMDAIGPEVAPESDAAVLSILGYDVHRYYTGRGPLESFGAGIDVHDGDLAWRANFGTVDPDWRIRDRRVGRNLTDAEAGELAAAVQAGVQLPEASFVFKHTLGHRACLVIRSRRGPLGGDIDNCDPGYQREGPFSVAVAHPGEFVQAARPLDGGQAAELGAELTNQFLRASHEVLRDHPVNRDREAAGKLPGNMILLRDAGDRLPQLPPIADRFGLKFGSLVEMPVEVGIAELTGMGQVRVPSTASDPAAGYQVWAAQTLAAVQDYDGLYVHLKGPDVPGHDGDFDGKRRSIELIDEFYFGPLLRELGEDFLIAVTADHSTPWSLKSHSADPVPVLVSGGGVEPEGTTEFTEAAAANGSLGRLAGPDLLPRLVELSRT